MKTKTFSLLLLLSTFFFFVDDIKASQEQKTIEADITSIIETDDLPDLKRLEEVVPTLIQDNAQELLRSSVVAGSNHILKYLLKKVKNIPSYINSHHEENKLTLLMIALDESHDETVKLLLDWGANPLLKDKKERTAFYYSKSPETTRLLKEKIKNKKLNLEGLTDPLPAHDIDTILETGQTSLIHAAANGLKKDVQILLEHGADIEIQDQNGMTALMWASYDGNEGIARLLLEYGANIEAQDDQGWSPLAHAAMSENSDIKTVQFLLEKGANIAAKDHAGLTPFQHAINSKNNQIARLLSGRLKKKEGKAPTLVKMIDSLFTQKKLDSIKKILKQSANISENELLLSAISLHKNNAIDYLLQLPEINLNIKSNKGTTPLMVAAHSKNNEALTKLIKHGADINATDNNEASALTYALDAKNLEGIDILLANNAIIDQARNIASATRGANTEILKKILEKEPSLASKKIKKGLLTMTPMLLAAAQGSPEGIRLLIDYGADPNEIVTSSPPPLFIAVNNKKYDIVEELLLAGATPLNEDLQKMLSSEQKKRYQSIRKKLKNRRRKKKTKSKVKTPTKVTQAPQRVSPLVEKVAPIAKHQLTQAEIVEQQRTANTVKLWELVNQGKAKQVSEVVAKPFNPSLTQQNENILARAVRLAIQDPTKGRRVLTVESLLSNPDLQAFINIPDATEQTLFQKAMNAGHDALIKILTDHGAIIPRIEAPVKKCPRPQASQKIYQQEKIEPTPTLAEISLSKDPLFDELKKGTRAKFTNIERIIKEVPGDLTRQRAAGKTPLMHAIESRVTEQLLRNIIKRLSPEHIDLEEQTRERDTALTKAIRTGRSAWINLLINSGALIQDKDLEVARKLYDDAQRENDQNKGKQLYENLNLLKQKKERQDANKMLLEATQDQKKGLEEVIRALDDNADINTQDTQGNTPLMYAIQANDNAKAQSLIERKARLNIRNKTGRTALSFATEKNNYKLVDYLLQHNANETIPDNTGATPLGYALRENYTNIANRIHMHKALKDLQKTGNITHVLNRRTTLGKNKEVILSEQLNQDIQNNSYIGHHPDKTVTTFFPQSWDRDTIQKAIESILKSPEQLHEQPARITEDNTVLRSALILRGTYEGIPIKVVISQTKDKHAPWKVFTAYPIN